MSCRIRVTSLMEADYSHRRPLVQNLARREADVRAEARWNGGRSRKAPALSDARDLQVRNAADVTTLLATTINEVRQGKLDPKVANAVGYLAGVLLRALEVGDLA